MKKYYFLVSLLIIVFVSNKLQAQGNQKVLQGKNEPSKVDKRIDNMGYWMKMAEKGIVTYNPIVPVRPAEFKGTQINSTGFSGYSRNECRKYNTKRKLNFC